jgi:RNA polymerase sigma-70 factor (ECF subfamily)
LTTAGLDEEFLARLLAFIRRRVAGDADADDILQDVLVKLVERGAQVREESVPAWLFTVARRAIVDRYRARPSDVPLPAGAADAWAAPAISAEDEVTAARELSRCLAPFLDELAEEERALLLRVDVEGESQAEIARSLGASPSTVKSRVQRARARVLERLTRCCAIALDGRGLPQEYRRIEGCECGEGEARC